MKNLPKQYDHKEAESRLQQFWEAQKTYQWDASQPRPNTFVIDTPPPTVSGILHMGHIFSYTQADFIARYQRMSGKTVFYPMGFDDNGLPTERLVEKEKKVRGKDMPREEFVAMCREVVKSAEDEFRRLFKSTAISVDWEQEYQTNSDEVTRISQASFLDLFAKNEVYRDFRPTYWDWVDQTAIAQAEIENKEMPGTMNELAFTLEDGTPLVIATTRPELLGACVAVMYHPEDPNAANYKDKYAITPLLGVKVPMIADELVEQGKGTGLVMCCTFGDDTDKEWWRKHELPMRCIITLDGKIGLPGRGENSLSFLAGKNGKFKLSYGDNHLHSSRLAENYNNVINIKKTIEIFEQIEGLKIKPAREKILELLKENGLLLKQEAITHTVKCAERSGTPIEIIPTSQWFVKIVDKKEALLEKGNQCNWNPPFMQIRLNQWIEGLKEDWCISRQRFFGVPFPLWYSKRAGEEGKILVADSDQLPLDPFTALPKGYSREEVEPSQDIMDTWATSSLTPQINARAISGNSDRYKKLFPADLRPQAHEIIRTWAFYTIVKSHLHADTIPWKNLMISGWCLASDKTKMSKSKGNVVTPVDLIKEQGADAVRYWASTSRLGADTAFSEDLLKIGRKLVNKLWNATSFAAIHLQDKDVSGYAITQTLDKWILTRLAKTIEKATENFEAFEYCDARVVIEEFFWKDFCDNYLELVKARAYGEAGDEAGRNSAHATLHHCLDAILKLFAPFVPHVTEELYQHIFAGQGSLHQRGKWATASHLVQDETAEANGVICLQILEEIRKAKSERKVSIKFPIEHMRIVGGEAIIQSFVQDLSSAGTVAKIEYVDSLPQDEQLITIPYAAGKSMQIQLVFG